MTLPRLQPLPKEDLPVVIYLGVSKDGKSALFLLEMGVEAVGDGDCDPNPQRTARPCASASARPSSST